MADQKYRGPFYRDNWEDGSIRDNDGVELARPESSSAGDLIVAALNAAFFACQVSGHFKGEP